MAASREPIYLRGNIWWCRVRNPNGGTHSKLSTGCRDRKAAVAKWREFERFAFAPADSAADQTTVADAIDARIEERRSAGRADGTIDMHTKKGRHLTRLLGADTPLDRVDASAVDAYVSTRLKEGAERTTVQKELVTLRGALKLARRRGKYRFTLDQVMPEFSAAYRPKERALSEMEIDALLGALAPKRAALVGLILATAATYPSELRKGRKSDVDLKAGYVRVRGTKRETRDRRVPIVGFARPWVERAVPYMPFERWTNIRRDLHVACAKAGIAPCSPTDLRRTMLSLLRARGVEPQLIGVFAGHADSRMVERVYGRLAPEQLAHLLSDRLKTRRRRTM